MPTLRARSPTDLHMPGAKDVAGGATHWGGLDPALIGLDEFVGRDDAAVDHV